MAHGNAANIRARLNHPILDGDGHWIESVPVVVDYLRSVAGADVANRYAANQTHRGAWYQASQAERARRRLGRGNWWITTANTRDFATAMLPALMVERMDELGIDFGVIYPTRCLAANSLPLLFA